MQEPASLSYGCSSILYLSEYLFAFLIVSLILLKCVFIALMLAVSYKSLIKIG